jgi:hypothetical protein
MMAYNQGLAERIEVALGDLPGLEQKKMFGGIGYLLDGNMACGVHGDALIVRVGRERYGDALLAPHTREFDMTGRPMVGWVVVGAEGIASDADLTDWVAQGVAFARTLPRK